MASQIHWFPGHMKKALEEINNKIKLVDVVIEILDARAPQSSINEEFEKIIAHKKRLIILSKSDLADPELTKKWEKKLSSNFDDILLLDLTNSQSGNIISKHVAKLGEEKHKKEIAKGMKPQPIKTMILGVPNVGKSSLINRFAKRRAAGVENRPGFTRGEQWIKINNDFILLDTPGVLPMNYENKEKAANLALIGAIREEILPNTDLAIILINFLKQYYPNALINRFKISEISDYKNVMIEISKNRGLLDANGKPDFARSEIVLLKEFKDGKLGKMTLDRID